MIQNFKLDMEGLVTFKFLRGDDILKTFQEHNAILGSAKTIVAERLANVPSSIINSIKLYNAGLLVASQPVYMITLPSPTEVEFSAAYLETDFSGDFNEARLYCESIGPFSGLTFPTQNKPGDQQLAVTWKIKIL